MVLKVYQTFYFVTHKQIIINKHFRQTSLTTNKNYINRLQNRSKYRYCQRTDYFEIVMGWYSNVIKFFIIIVYLSFCQVSLVYNKGLVKFRDMRISKNMQKLMDGECCKKCQCTVIFRICLQHISRDECLIRGQSNRVIHSGIQEFDLELTSTYKGPMRITVEGADNNTSSKNDLVFKIRDNKPLWFENSTSWYTSYSSPYVNISFQYQLACPENFYGPYCAVLCEPRDDKLGHYTCDRFGKRICIRGWKGKYCQERTCEGSCGKGICNIATNKCNCSTGWEGDRCNIKSTKCPSVPCQNNGICERDSRICICKYGFTGKFCENQLLHSSSSSSLYTFSPSSFGSSSPSPLIFSSSMVKHSARLIKTTYQTLLSTKDYIIGGSSSQKHSNINRTRSFKTNSTRSQKIMTSYSSIKPMTVSEIISSTAWVTVPYTSSMPSVIPTTRSNTTITEINVFPTVRRNGTIVEVNVISKPSTVLVSIISVLSVLLLLAGIVFLLVVFWKRNKFKRFRKSESLDGALLKRNYSESIKSVRSGLSLDTTASGASLMLKYAELDRESGSGAAGSDVDLISVIDYPELYLPSTPNVDFEKYTLQAVDRICWEAIRGKIKSPNLPNKTKGRRKSKVSNGTIPRNPSATKTLSNASNKSQSSSGYYSSGCNSSRNSPGTKSIHFESRAKISDGLNTESSFTSIMKLIHGITDNTNKVEDCDTQSADIQDTLQIKSFHNFLNNNSRKNALNIESNENNNNNNTIELRNIDNDKDSDESSDGSFLHAHRMFEATKFEGLPNFICYQDDKDAV